MKLQPLPTWTAFSIPKLISEEEWNRLQSMIGEDEYVIVTPISGEDSQGSWVKHELAISPRGIMNLQDHFVTLMRTGLVK